MSEVETMPVYLPALIPVQIPVVQNVDQIVPDVDIQDLPGTYDITEKEDQAFKVPDQKIEIIAKILMDGTVFKEVFGSIAALTPECKLNISQSGITARCVDVANVAMIDLEYKKEMFELFKVTAEPVKIGIDISHIYGLRTMIKKGSLVLMEFTKKTVPEYKTKHNNGDIVTIKEQSSYYYDTCIEGTETKDKALDINTIRREPNLPTIELSTTLDISADHFIQGIKDGSKVSDKVALIYDKGIFSMVFEGDTRTMNKIVPTLSSTTKDPAVKVRSLFSIDYLKDMVKTLNKKEIITLKIGKDHPMSLTRQNEVRTIIFMLAPRIEAN